MASPWMGRSNRHSDVGEITAKLWGLKGGFKSLAMNKSLVDGFWNHIKLKPTWFLMEMKWTHRRVLATVTRVNWDGIEIRKWDYENLFMDLYGLVDGIRDGNIWTQPMLMAFHLLSQGLWTNPYEWKTNQPSCRYWELWKCRYITVSLFIEI